MCLISSTSICLATESVPQFLQLKYLSARLFYLELLNYHQLFHKVSLLAYPSETFMPALVLKSLPCSQHSVLLLSSQRHLFSLLLKTRRVLRFSVAPVVLHLLEHFSSGRETEADVTLTLLIELNTGSVAMPWQRTFILASLAPERSPFAYPPNLANLVTSRPTLLVRGISAQMHSVAYLRAALDHTFLATRPFTSLCAPLVIANQGDRWPPSFR